MQLSEIHWEITNMCNLGCKHCLPMSGRARENELTTEEAMVALVAFQAAGASRICLTGGEPFSRSDILDLLERSFALGLKSSVITNATLLPKATLETIKRLGVDLGISLDGADQATNDAIRGDGSYKCIIETLIQCRALGISTTLYVTVSAINIEHLNAFAKLAVEYGCNSIHFNEITISGRAYHFSDELKLSEDQKKHLPEMVVKIASDIFGEILSDADEHCWVDGVTLNMTADGNLYVCSEVFQRRPDLAIGNIRSFVFETLLEQTASAYSGHEYKCCYSVCASKHVIFVGNIATGCAFAKQKPFIETLPQLYDVLGELYPRMELDCRECSDPDCMGYVWLLKKEAAHLYEQGVPLVQVNNGPTFIHSFPVTAQGVPDLSIRYPPCSQLCTDSRRCSIYKDRPLACRLYPLGLETEADGTIVWALHLDCLHVRRLEERGLLPELECRVLKIIDEISPKLLEEIVETYRAVDAISSFPDGDNKYKPLRKVSYVKM
ncbi:MAG: radical SAM protein [Candidatus Taylorbacteria bacterium]